MRKIVNGVKGFEKDRGALIFYEQFKALRAKFEHQLDSRKYKVVAVTSSIAEEGKTCTCVNLAANLASIGRKKVLLVDADLRKSDLAHYLNVSTKPGLSDYLNGSAPLEKVINKTMEGLYFIPGGERTNGASELLAGEKFRSFLVQMRDKFDLILLDTPPVLPVADTMSIKDQVDAFIFIFRMGFTPYVMLRQVIEDMGKEKIIGVVLNRVEPQSQKYYKRYYGKYYHKISV
ncbi:MAG TPA: CpsD/CapB family tyrosine-protein kinase [Nitrospiraceae bacterium]